MVVCCSRTSCDAPAQLLVGQAGCEALCRDCHVAACDHRIGTTLRRCGALADGATLVLGVSGSAASMLAFDVLLRRVRTGDRGERKRGDCAFSLVAVHVDETPLPFSCAPPDAVVKAMRDRVNATAAAMPSASSAAAFKSFVRVETIPIHEDLDADAVRAAVMDVVDRTAREDFARTLRFRALERFTRERETEQEKTVVRLLTCETSVRLAARALALVAKGQGHLLRQASPSTLAMQDVTSKDAALAARHRGLEVFGAMPRGAADEPSINSATDAFVEHMHADMPRTAPTILRTLAKLEPLEHAKEEEDDNGNCGR